MNNEEMAVMLYAVYGEGLNGTVKMWEDLTMDQRQSWRKVAGAAFTMAHDEVEKNVAQLEDRHDGLREELWNIMQRAAILLGVSINEDRH